MNIYESEEKEVKKDKQWLRNRYEQMETVKMTTKNSRGSKSVSYIKKKTAINLLNQLDEPEVLSSDWIKDNQLMWTSIHGAEYYVPANKLYGKIVPKQEKVKVTPKEERFIKECRIKDYSLHDFVHCLEVTNENCERLTRAWLDGYRVEEEQKYYVIDKEDNILLIRGYEGIEKADNLKITNSGGGALKLTEQEIKDYDPRYWAFRKPIEEIKK